MSRTIRSTLIHKLDEVGMDATAIGGGYYIIDTPIARDVVVLIDFSYDPAERPGADDPGAPAEVAIRSIQCQKLTSFTGEKVTMQVMPGFDLLEVLPEIEVEKLEEMIIKRAQNKDDV